MNIEKLTSLYEKNKTLFDALGVIVLLLVLIVGVMSLNTNEVQAPRYSVDEAELQKNIEQRKQFFTVNDQSVDSTTLENDVKNQLLDELIIEEYADKNGISVSEEALENYYQTRVAQFESEDALLERIEELYGMNKTEYRTSLRNDLLREAVQVELETPLQEWLSEQRADKQLVIE